MCIIYPAESVDDFRLNKVTNLNSVYQCDKVCSNNSSGEKIMAVAKVCEILLVLETRPEELCIHSQTRPVVYTQPDQTSCVHTARPVVYTQTDQTSCVHTARTNQLYTHSQTRPVVYSEARLDQLCTECIQTGSVATQELPDTTLSFPAWHTLMF